jgi:hypothetical protein
MSERTTADRVGECVHVLRAMGIPPSDVTDRYGATGSDPVAALSEALSDTSDRRLYDLLHESIARSERGIECPRDHDLATAEDALGEALARYDCTLSVRGEDPVTVEAEDAAAETRSTTVSLPAALPDGDPLPAVAGAVDRDLLEGTGLTLVLLSEREDVWRLALLPERRLTDLQERLGVRLSVFGRALLCADQPRAFLEGRARAYAPATDGGGLATAGDGVGTAGGDAAAPTVETPVDPATLGEGRHESPDPNPRVETGAVDRLLADLSAVLDGEETDDAADSSGPTVAVGGGPTRTVGEGVDDIVAAVTDDLGREAAALSDAFDAVEREAASADAAPTGSAAAVGGGPTRVVADESVEAVLSSVGVGEGDADPDLDLDEALASMAGEFDGAPSLPEPLAAARNGR